MCFYITFLKYPEKNDRYNQYDGYHHPYIFHNGMWHFGRFSNMEYLQQFLDFAGLAIELIEEKETDAGKWKMWKVNLQEIQEHGFWNTDTIPEEARCKPFLGLSNGSTTQCYLYNDGNVLHVYRPNPNAKNVYVPLSIKDDIAHRRKWYV